MPKRRDFLEGLSDDDPNYQIAKRFYLKAWADSHGLAADVLSGRLRLSDFVEGCVKTFDHAARAHVAFEDATSIPERCRELDGMAKKFIRQFSDTLSSKSKRLGKANTTAAIEQLSRRVNEIAARSKQRILEAALTRDAPPLSPIARPTGPTHRSNRWIERCLGSHQVAYVRVPRLTCEFPAAFPQAARAKVLAARLRAEELFSEKKGSIREFADAEALLLELILDIFLTFAEEGYRLGIEGRLTAVDLESECLMFLKNYAAQAGLMDNLLAVPDGGGAEIPDDLRRRIECSDEWKEYRRRLREVADAQASEPAHPPKSTTRGKASSADAAAAKEARAKTVGQIVKELNALKPQMFEDESEYDGLRTQNSNFLTFKIAAERPDLKLKVLAISGSTRHIRLAQELAAAHYGRALSTIQDDWKHHKPADFKRHQ